MSSLYMYCSACRAANDPGSEYCHQCGQSLHVQTPIAPIQPPGLSRRMSRRTAILTLGGIVALQVVGIVSAVEAGLTYWELTNPHVRTYSMEFGPPSDASWSPDSTRIASAGLRDGNVQIWDVITGKTLQICRTDLDLSGSYVLPQNVIWSADGKHVLAFAGLSPEFENPTAGSHIAEMLYVWDVATGQSVSVIPVMEPVTINAQATTLDPSVVRKWALNEHYLATANGQKQGMLSIWDIATGSRIATLGTESQGAVIQIFWSPDHKKLAIEWIGQDIINGHSTLEIWSVETLNKIVTLDADGQHPFSPVAWAPDSRRLLLASGSGEAMSYEVWDVLTGKKLQTLKSTLSAEFIRVWSPNGKYLVLGNELYDMETGNRITTYTLQGSATWLAWSPDSTRVILNDIIGSHFFMSGSLYVFDALSGIQRAHYYSLSLFVNRGTLGPLIWSPDGKYVMVVGSDIDIWKGV